MRPSRPSSPTSVASPTSEGTFVVALAQPQCCPVLTFHNRVKQLKEEPYTQKTAEAAVGLWTDNKGPNKPQTHDIDMS